MEKIGDRIVKLRNLKRFTQDDLSKKINVSDKVISKWECGESLPNIEDLTNLSNFFKVSMDYLVKGVANQSDTNVLNTKYEFSAQELNDEIKNTCLKVLKDNNLIKYKDLLIDEVKYIKHIGMFNCGVFYAKKFTDGINFDEQIKSEHYIYSIDTIKVLELDNYNIFEKLNQFNMLIISKKFDHSSETNSYEVTHFNGLTLKQLTDLNLTDVGFYEAIDEPGPNLDLALEDILTNPNKWNIKIIKNLLHKGAYVRKIIGIKEEFHGAFPIYAKDIFATLQLKEYVKDVDTKSIKLETINEELTLIEKKRDGYENKENKEDAKHKLIEDDTLPF